MKETNAWYASNDSRKACAPYVSKENSAKLTRINHWKNQINQTLQSRKEITHEQLDRELQEVVKGRETKN